MDRRSFLRMIGLAPVAGAALAAMPAPSLATGGVVTSRLVHYRKFSGEFVLTQTQARQIAKRHFVMAHHPHEVVEMFVNDESWTPPTLS